MTPYTTWLLCLVEEGVLFKVAIKFDINKLPQGIENEFLEEENKNLIMKNLGGMYQAAELVGIEIIEDAIVSQ